MLNHPDDDIVVWGCEGDSGGEGRRSVEMNSRGCMVVTYFLLMVLLY